jgi:sugar lactone lactonase YvrE
VDCEGRLYVATALGVQVCDQAGRVNAIIPTPNGRVTNLCFGGHDMRTLFLTDGPGNVWMMRDMPTPGLQLNIWPTPA